MELYELRWYEVAVGKMDDLHKRMRDIAPLLFARNGLPQPSAIWEAVAAPALPSYLYLLRWNGMREREAAFNRQYADTDRPPTRDTFGQELTTRIHLSFLRPSACWDAFAEPLSSDAVGGIHELVIQNVANRRLGEAEAAWRSVDLPLLVESGARLLGVFEGWVGLRRPSLVKILAWPDAAMRERGRLRHRDHPRVTAARAVEAAASGRPLFESATTFLLRPAEYGMPRAGFGHYS